jgi:hypothetical protein
MALNASYRVAANCTPADTADIQLPHIAEPDLA